MNYNAGYTDRILTCRECGQTFTFTAGEQEFYASRNLTNDPSRCPDCRAARRSGQGGGDSASAPRAASATRQPAPIVGALPPSRSSLAKIARSIAATASRTTGQPAPDTATRRVATAAVAMAADTDATTVALAATGTTIATKPVAANTTMKKDPAGE